ncbi:hypothetical protein AB3N04_01010 (plasmid) [Alkalihalophilus sp. As8PL]|uniref:Uncharacterized protein n=1 Tax=Alkalihalophilus sp. As8PL TaxID=3237103 RepID=A0AB39BNS3_9BACI
MSKNMKLMCILSVLIMIATGWYVALPDYIEASEGETFISFIQTFFPFYVIGVLITILGVYVINVPRTILGHCKVFVYSLPTPIGFIGMLMLFFYPMHPLFSIVSSGLGVFILYHTLKSALRTSKRVIT